MQQEGLGQEGEKGSVRVRKREQKNGWEKVVVGRQNMNAMRRVHWHRGCLSGCGRVKRHLGSWADERETDLVAVLFSIQEMLTGQRLCHSESHNDSVLAALNRQRSDGILCDVTLVAEEQKFHAHKAVLAACSDYFRVSEGGFFLLRCC